MMCTTARPPLRWSSVARLWAATVGYMVFGRSATIGLIRSVHAAIVADTVNGS
jgi:hypothetical protein